MCIHRYINIFLCAIYLLYVLIMGIVIFIEMYVIEELFWELIQRVHGASETRGAVYCIEG